MENAKGEGKREEGGGILFEVPKLYIALDSIHRNE
jgi:hypothetical protein